jgi:hypothetical protein
MAENEVQPQAGIPKLRRLQLPGRPSLATLIALVALALSLASITLQVIQDHRLQSRIEGLEWSDEVRGQDSYLDTVEPSVGTIQFLRRGYTVEFTKVNYTPGGLVLDGFIGNPTQIWISSLTLQLTAYEPRSAQRTRFFREKSHDSLFFFFEESIGSAQTETIDSLPPGGRQPFHVTIPNIRQTKEGFQLTVAFSGERYSYGS